MTEIHTQVLSAFCDGEIIDPDLLAAALADPQGRAVLTDFARLRAAVAPSGPLPASLGEMRRSSRPRLGAWTMVAAAAAMVLLMVAAASLLPRALFTKSTDPVPPSPSRVVRYEPGVDWHAEGAR